MVTVENGCHVATASHACMAAVDASVWPESVAIDTVATSPDRVILSPFHAKYALAAEGELDNPNKSDPFANGRLNVEPSEAHAVTPYTPPRSVIGEATCTRESVADEWFPMPMNRQLPYPGASEDPSFIPQ